MKQLDKLFFELVRVSIGTQESLSRKPEFDEWSALYKEAQKQALIGVCFAGVKKLCNSDSEDYYGMSELLYLTWMGVATEIQQRNNILDAQCVELQRRLSADGFQSCVLKGQGIATLYGATLHGLRHPGDIDVWIDASVSQVLEYTKKYNNIIDFDYLHVSVDLYKNTEVELHYRPGCMYNLRTNAILQSFFEDHKNNKKIHIADGYIVVPTNEFNILYILQHAYRHLMNGGIGLRQLMDYFFVLNEYHKDFDDKFIMLIKELGMMRFTSAVMWIMKEVFGIDKMSLICEPDEVEGQFLLDEIMQSGNFGQYDTRFSVVDTRNKVKVMLHKLRRNLHLLFHYPSEVLWVPIYYMWHYIWKRNTVKL